MKQVEFIYVDGLNSNSNKFYRMIDTEDGNFRVEYGRIGLTLITETYPIGKWDSKYKEKGIRRPWTITRWRRFDGSVVEAGRQR